MKKLLKQHNPFIIIFTIIEIIISIIAILAFVYDDQTKALPLDDLRNLLQTLYSQTWWGLTLFTVGLSSILSLTSIIYKKLDYYFISICLWVMLTILALNLNQKMIGSLKTLLLFIPIIIIKILCYKREQEVLNKKTKKKNG